jgi:uncharacterized OB-fold protein
MEASFILPDLEDDDATPFWEGTARGELLVQKCSDCGRMRIPPRPMCPHCRSLANEWMPLSGKGRVWSFVVPHPPLLPAYTEFAPFNVIAVELDEDPTLRLIGNLVASADGAINQVDPRTIEIGEPVRVVFAKVDDVYLPRWVRA